ncbi:ABC-type transporter, integral membrane subunit [uncultured spirochete]|jgi:raffinose/stachyose/melibiose transport system permease protein|uniref:ABC-type transporter, integral membrane subunit n=1 Tax=uncultured spirochete TaxID=156406 RepID=A0A3P3XLQ3_9SPIR|nr:carbohydrate ABC transporter permease [Rectinema subterraneum]SLM15651.1 ABC-type transporter, integral membrane subunit [uncultured spirochete]HBE46614.1 sugar ABC transporter permease [Spirochaetaceae bacterium]HCX97194.1 sugar ABC transporter permease [Spirochaetaceae bacterium]
MKQLRSRKPGMIVAEIVTALLFILFLFPFVLVLLNSAKTSFEVTQYPLAWPSRWGNIIDNVVKIWTSESVRYPSSLLTSTIVTVVSLVLINLFSAQAGWVLVRTKSRISSIIFFIFVASMVIPFQIVMFPLLSWFRTVTVATGIRLLRTYQGIILAYIGFGAPLSIFMFHGFIKSIPLELEEAATIDGCKKYQIFYRIIFPILTPIQATVLVLNGIWIWNDYLLPLLVLGKGNDIMTIPLAVSNFAGAFVKQWDLILTAILMAMVPVIIFFLFAQKYIVKGMVAGAIK